MPKSEVEKFTAYKILNQVLVERIKKNPMYSLRSMARDLNLSAPYLSNVLNGKKKISLRRAVEISSILKLTPARRQSFLEAVAEEHLYFTPKIKIENYFNMDEKMYLVLENWLSLPILDLTTTENFISDEKWIAKRLRANIHLVKKTIGLLLELGLLKKEGHVLKKTEKRIRFQTSASKSLVVQFHKQMISKAVDILDEKSDRDFELREISGITMAINPEKIHLAKKMIQNFKQELAQVLTSEKTTEVYQFNVQLFPLTKEEKSHE